MKLEELKNQVDAFRKQILDVAREHAAKDAKVMPLIEIGKMFLDLHEKTRKLEHRLSKAVDECAAGSTLEITELKSQVAALKEKLDAIASEHEAQILVEKGNANRSEENFQSAINAKIRAEETAGKLRVQVADLMELHDKLLPLRDREIRDLKREKVQTDDQATGLQNALHEHQVSVQEALRPLLIHPLGFLKAFGPDAYQNVKNLFVRSGGNPDDCPPPPPEKVEVIKP